jgi:hypothetical protein
MVAILDTGRRWRTQFWKVTTQGSFQQSLVEIGSVVSAYFDRLCKLEKGGMKLKKILLLWNYWANLNQTLLKWSLGGPLSKLCPSVPSCIQDGHLGYRKALTNTIWKGDHPRIISAKFGWDWHSSFREDFLFELYKHNDELFNIYYRIFYELWTFAYFDRLCKLEKRGDEIKKKFFSETTEPISTKLCWNDPWVVPIHFSKVWLRLSE